MAARVTSRAAVPILAVGGLGVVTLLAIAVTTGVSDGFDAAVIGVVRSDAFEVPLSPLRWVTELGSTGAVTLVAIVAIVLGVLIGPWLHGLLGAVTIALASLGNHWIKVFIARNRPDLLEPVLVERGFSFPSGHALLSMVTYGVLGVLVMRSRLPLALRRGVVAILGVVVLLVGLSRVWLGVHYPTDVLAGWTTGAVIVLVFARLTRSVSPEPAAAEVDADQAVQRSDPPAPG